MRTPWQLEQGGKSEFLLDLAEGNSELQDLHLQKESGLVFALNLPFNKPCLSSIERSSKTKGFCSIRLANNKSRVGLPRLPDPGLHVSGFLEAGIFDVK